MNELGPTDGKMMICVVCGEMLAGHSFPILWCDDDGAITIRFSHLKCTDGMDADSMVNITEDGDLVMSLPSLEDTK